MAWGSSLPSSAGYRQASKLADRTSAGIGVMVEKDKKGLGIRLYANRSFGRANRVPTRILHDLRNSADEQLVSKLKGTKRFGGCKDDGFRSPGSS